jgi:hypothetical protein
MGRLVVAVLVLVVLGVGAAAFVLLQQAKHAQEVVGRMRGDATVLQRQLQAFDLRGAAGTMRSLRTDAADANRTTGNPLWAVAGGLPVLGDDIGAARDVSSSVAGILDAAAPLEAALPRLDPKVTKGTLDVDALATVADALPALSAAVARADTTVAAIDTPGLQPQLASGVTTLQGQLGAVREPLANAVPALQILPSMLGQDRPKTWLVLLQQNAEARGTGGLVGAYAMVTTDKGRIRLTKAAPRQTLESRRIPATAVPQELRDLWGSDLREWAGLNLSPHFPWTGQLVSAGWASKKGPKLDYVAAIDQYAVAALLAGTGPARVGGDVVTSANAVKYLSSEVYLRHPDHQDVDRITQQLVVQTFAKVSAGKIDFRALVTAIAQQSGDRHILAWAADGDEQKELESLSVGGALPSSSGPFAMAVVNNGGGNKMDAYLQVRIGYDSGPCVQDTRIGALSVRLLNTAPARGLTDYQSVRSDLLEDGVRRWVRGSNRVLLDLYGPVGSRAPLITLDGRQTTPVVSGTDRGHSVWRIEVPILPGQERKVNAVLVQPVDDGARDMTPQVLLQPMAIPQTASVRAVTPCSS